MTALREEVCMLDCFEIAQGLTPLQKDALAACCMQGSVRTNDGGIIDTLLSGLCSNTAKGINNGWLIEWSMNPACRLDGYLNLYKPTSFGLDVYAAFRS